MGGIRGSGLPRKVTLLGYLGGNTPRGTMLLFLLIKTTRIAEPSSCFLTGNRIHRVGEAVATIVINLASIHCIDETIVLVPTNRI
jgi:hypothetical protein